MRGGGTERRAWPQVGQFSEARRSARSQWPLDSQSGFIHWTVEPGINGMNYSPPSHRLTSGCELPWRPKKIQNRAENCRIVAWGKNVVNGKELQAVVVLLQSCGKRSGASIMRGFGMKRRTGMMRPFCKTDAAKRQPFDFAQDRQAAALQKHMVVGRFAVW